MTKFESILDTVGNTRRPHRQPEPPQDQPVRQDRGVQPAGIRQGRSCRASGANVPGGLNSRVVPKASPAATLQHSIYSITTIYLHNFFLSLSRSLEP